MDEGPGHDLGLPIDPDEDSDNSPIYVQGLNDNVTLGDLSDFFKQCGVVKMNKRTGQLMIHIYVDKETGKPKGDATVSYEDRPTAKAAMEWFEGKDFQGSKLNASLARKKPPTASGLACHLLRAEGCHHHSEVLVAQKVPEALWVTWKALEETEKDSPHETPGAPEGPPMKEEKSSTELDIGSVPIRAVETRTSPGEQNGTSVRQPSMRASSHHYSHLWVVILA